MWENTYIPVTVSTFCFRLPKTRVRSAGQWPMKALFPHRGSRTRTG